MKHLFLSLAALCVVALSGSAQCSADFDFMGAPFGVSPDAAEGETFEDGIVGQPYSETIHVMLPSSLADVPDSPVTSGLDSVAIESIVLEDETGAVVLLADIGLTMTPNNNGVSPNPNMFLGGGQYCAQLSGTPTVTGVFSAKLTTLAYLAPIFPGFPVLEFPFEFDGYTLTITESTAGCTDASACNYDASATEDDMSCEFPGDMCDDMNANTENDMVTADCGCEGTCISDVDGDGICDEEEVAGCTDSGACNYDASATDDDMSCELPGDMCNDMNANTENDMVTADCGCEGTCISDADGDGICDEEEVAGCTDSGACNYDASATDDDMSCELPGDMCDDMNANTENDTVTADCGCEGTCISDADGDGICDEEEVAGCTDQGACNYDAAATDDDGTCEEAEEHYDCDGNCLSDMDGDGVCDELEVLGCNSPYACNYDETATDDDGSCLVVGDACDDGDANTENDAINEACECEGQIPDLIGSQDFIGLEVYPNPVLDVLNVTLPQGAVHGLSLKSISGQTVLSNQVSVEGSLALDVSALPAGAYLLKVVSPHAWTIRKVMIGSH